MNDREIVFQSLEWEVTRNAKGRWYFRPRPHFLLGLTLLNGFLAWLCLAFGPRLEGFLGSGGVLLFVFLGRLLVLASAMTLLACLVNQRRKVSLHPASGTIAKGRELLTGGFRLQLRDTELSGRKVVSLWAVPHDGREVLLVPGQFEEKRSVLEELQSELQVPDADGILAPGLDSFPIVPAIAGIFGVLWAVGGYLWAPGLVWDIDGTHGVLVWPFGFFVMALGVLEFLGIRIMEAAEKKGPATLLGVALLAVYAWLCWRPL